MEETGMIFKKRIFKESEKGEGGNMEKSFWKKSIGICLCMVLLAQMFLPSVQAAQQPLLLSQIL